MCVIRLLQKTAENPNGNLLIKWYDKYTGIKHLIGEGYYAHIT